ncbi:mitogen-activated protein kinase kinase kinase 19 [Aquarana catesbeiana]|uniref:mitogen-activated protein kinase kinase kinase 19 n=1 Tax=Aquarana catesbeiana TaxID=8400 RepID=UPI003CC9DABD
MEESSQKKEMLIEFLQCAAMGDMEQIITTLKCHPDLINAEHSESGDTALIVAARENQPEVIAILLDHGADVTLCNSNCQTALHIANDGIRAHLLSAVKRTSYPQLALAQAAWQGDLDTIQDFLSADSCQDVNTINVQGLTPLMLVVRDVDLFEGLTMECKYQPVSVLEELLRHHGDAHLLDLNENSAMSYASQVKSPIRQQLMDLLEKSPPPPETLDEDFCGFCPDTKPSLFDRTASTLDRPDSQNTHSGKEPLCDGIIVEDISQEPEAEVPICPEAGGAEGAPVYDLEKNTMDERKKNVLPAQWLPDFSPEHLTSRPSIRKNPSLPPLYVKKDEKDVQLERLGLGYLLKGSHSDPNIPEAQLAVDPLRNLRYIKEHIKQRLSSSDSPGNSKTFPPIYYSPLSPKSYRLSPLPKSSSRNSLTERSITILNSEMFDKSRHNRLTCKHESVGKPVDGLDLVLSKDQVQISLDSVTSPESENHTSDLSRSAHSGIRLASGRREDKGGSTSHNNTSLPQIFSRLPELHTHDKTPRSSWREKTHSSFKSEPLAVQKSHKTVRDTHNDSRDNELVTNCDQDPLKDQTDLLHSSMPNKNTKDNIKMPLNDNRLPYVSKVIESIKNNSPRTPRASYVPFVQITFSEQEAETEVHCPPVKQPLVKGKPNLSILTHVRSFNINAHKENKSKKTKNIRNHSATNLKCSRPLSNSNRNSGKCVPLPTLAYSSGPSPSRLSKTGRPKLGSAERNSQRSQTQLSLYTKKRPKSPANPAMALRAKSADDFQNIHYSDMFVEIKSQNNGPGIFQMFESPVYRSPKDDRKGRKEASSASSTRSCSSKGIRSESSRDSSARSSKSMKPGNRKKSSATSSRRKGLTKSGAAEDISEKNKDNQVIISGTDWEIKTIKDERNVNEIITDKPPKNIPDLPYQAFSELSIIKEATIENSLTGNQAAQTTFIKMFQEVGQVNHTENLKKEHVDPVTPEERNGIENVGPQAKSCEEDEEQRGQISEAGDFGLRPQISATRRPSEGLQLSLGKATLNNLNSREKNEEEILIEDSERSHQLYSTSIPTNSKDNSGTSDMLIYFKRCLEEIDEHSKNSKTMENHQDNDQSANNNCKQQAEKPGRKINTIQINRCSSPTDSDINNSNQSGNYFNTSNNDSSIYWIKGEVLGRGAYGTVYKGLTSQGELIAAKQVTLHASDSDVAEKEYKKLQEEVDLLKTLKHDNIVGYLGTCLQDNIVTIFMEYVPGGSMANILRDFGPLQEAVISKFTNHILQGIAYLHKNRVVHRDIKGNNVMLMPNGVIKLIDFGCAKRLNGLSMNSSRREMLKSMHGTPYWMAPEVISESGHGEKSDIWSIGCTVFEMATGKPPLAHMNRLAAMFYIAGHKGFMPTLPDHFSKKARDFVNLCLIREQEERPSAEQLLQHSFTREKTPPQKSFQPTEDA